MKSMKTTSVLKIVVAVATILINGILIVNECESLKKEEE